MVQHTAQIRGLDELIVVGLATPLGSASSANHTNKVKQKQKGVVGLGEKNGQIWYLAEHRILRSSGRCQQAFLLGRLLLGLRGHWHILLLRRHLAGLVEDSKKDEYEDAHDGVADDGHDSPH